jgi:hypothetical protein
LRVPRELFPGRDRPDEFHEREAAHEIGASLGEVKGEAASPVLRHEIGRANPHLREKGVEVTDVVLEAIGDVRLARLTEANEVRRDATGDRRDQRDNISPDV